MPSKKRGTMTSHKTASLMFGLAVLLYSSESLTAADEKQQVAPKLTFLVIYRPGPGWLAGKSISEQPLKEHGTYMLSLYVQGWMKLAGSLTDNAGGAVVLEVTDESQAKAIVAEAPAVKSGIFICEMHPWELKAWDNYAKKAKSSAKLGTRTDATASPQK
jgi:uncharacterized protein YciI